MLFTVFKYWDMKSICLFGIFFRATREFLTHMNMDMTEIVSWTHEGDVKVNPDDEISTFCIKRYDHCPQFT